MIRMLLAQVQDRLAHGRDWRQWGASALLICSEVVLLMAALMEGYAIVQAIGQHVQL
jgi:hypothetical protein